MKKSKMILLIQLGGPSSPSIENIREFLGSFLSNPRVVQMKPRIIWKAILWLIKRRRPTKIQEYYQREWENGKFRVDNISSSLVASLQNIVGEEILVRRANVFSKPKLDDSLKEIVEELKNIDEELKLNIICYYPQSSESVSSLIYDEMVKTITEGVNIPHIEFVPAVDRTLFAQASLRQIQVHLDEDIETLFIAFHSLPEKQIELRGDKYLSQCQECFDYICQGLSSYGVELKMVFQSRFRKRGWLGPDLEHQAKSMLKQGGRNMAVYCASFLVDNLETHDEVGVRLRSDIERRGGKLKFIPCLNDNKQWLQELSQVIIND